MQNRGLSNGYSLEEWLEMPVKDPERFGVGRSQGT